MDPEFKPMLLLTWPTQRLQEPEVMPNIHANRSNSEINRTCSICLEDIHFDGTGNMKEVALTCNHLFHDACIQEWFKKSKNCPQCQSEKTIVSDAIYRCDPRPPRTLEALFKSSIETNENVRFLLSIKEEPEISDVNEMVATLKAKINSQDSFDGSLKVLREIFR